jgi:hypothetical protein
MAVSDFRIGAGELSINGDEIGHTTPDGIVVSYEPNIHLHESGKYGHTPVKATLIGVTLTLQASMAEHTHDNMLLAYAGAEESGDKLQLGGVAGRELEGKTCCDASEFQNDQRRSGRGRNCRCRFKMDRNSSEQND